MMHDKPGLMKGLRLTPDILEAFVKTIPDNKLHLRRGEGFWTIAEHLSHLAEVQPMLLDRFQRFMDEDYPVFIPFAPGKVEEEEASAAPLCMSIVAALQQFAQYRLKQLVLLENADDIIWQRTASHPEYDQYSLYILTRHILMHDYWHMYRMEELWLTKDAYLTKLE